MVINAPNLYKITLNLSDQKLSKVITENEFRALEKKGAFKEKAFSPLNALFTTQKQLSWKTTLQNFSLPLFFNIAIQKNKLFENSQNQAFCDKTIIVLSCLTLDLLTLPLRFVLLPFALFSSTHQLLNHPLTQFAINHGFNKNSLHYLDRIDLCLERFSLSCGAQKYTSYYRVETSVDFKGSFRPKVFQLEDKIPGGELYNYACLENNPTLELSNLNLENRCKICKKNPTYNPFEEFSVTVCKQLMNLCEKVALETKLHESDMISLNLKDRIKIIERLHQNLLNHQKTHPDDECFQLVNKNVNMLGRCYIL